MVREEENYVYFCCEDFAHAFDEGTDNEGCGSLFSYSLNRRRIEASCHDNPIKFCPFCGVVVRMKQGKVQ